MKAQKKIDAKFVISGNAGKFVGNAAVALGPNLLKLLAKNKPQLGVVDQIPTVT